MNEQDEPVGTMEKMEVHRKALLHRAFSVVIFNSKGDVLDSANWKKHPRPVFVQSAEDSVFAPGHNSFFKSPDGKEDWIIYHANPTPDAGCGNRRAPHMQKFSWTRDGLPYFGKPVGRKALPVPSGSY